MFAGFDPDLTAQEIQKRLHYRTSVLDYARGETDRLRGKLGRSDQAKLDQYLTGVRELEQRLGRPSARAAPGTPPGELEYPDHVKFMLDLIALVMHCDLTRVATFMLGNAGSNRSHTQIGIADAHHEPRTTRVDPAKRARLVQIDRWEVEQLAYLLGKLEAQKEIDGSSVLDHAVLYFSSEIEDGNLHSHFNMPVLVGGGGGGALATGRHVRYTNQPAMGDLFIALLAAAGVTTARFGDDGTKPLPGIRVAPGRIGHLDRHQAPDPRRRQNGTPAPSRAWSAPSVRSSRKNATARAAASTRRYRCSYSSRPSSPSTTAHPSPLRCPYPARRPRYGFRYRRRPPLRKLEYSAVPAVAITARESPSRLGNTSMSSVK